MGGEPLPTEKLARRRNTEAQKQKTQSPLSGDVRDLFDRVGPKLVEEEEDKQA